MQHLVYLLTNFCLSPAPTPISFKSITVQQKFHGTSFHCPYGSGKRCSWEAGGCGGSTKVVPILLLLFLLIFWCKLLWKLLVITGRRNNGRFNFNKYFHSLQHQKFLRWFKLYHKGISMFNMEPRQWCICSFSCLDCLK